MISVGHVIVALAVCLVPIPNPSTAFPSRRTAPVDRCPVASSSIGPCVPCPCELDRQDSRSEKSHSRHHKVKPHQVVFSPITFKDELPPSTTGHRRASLVLECEAQALPAPTIHWLKDGVRIPRGYSESVEDETASYQDQMTPTGPRMIGLSSTKSRLHLPCLSSKDSASYTCVAETPYRKATQNTTVRVGKRSHDSHNGMSKCFGRRSHKATPARIHMYTVSRLEFEGFKVQLFCRAEGYPKPVITWYDRNNKPIYNSNESYQLLDNGDLVINSISWYENMGIYTCVADNGVAIDTAKAFLYPAAQ